MKKNKIPLMLAVIFIVSILAACSPQAENPPPGGSLTIIHMNDTHGRAQADPYISELAKGLRANGENVLVLDAGDRLHGQTATNLTKGETMAEVMNAAGYSAMVTGNHDYAFGITRLLELSEMMNFPLLAANVRYNGSYVFERYRIFSMDGFTVGLFGLATPETVTSSDPRSMAGLEFENPAATAAEMAALLQSENCDIIIALTHLGNDSLTAEDEKSDAIAAIPGVDVVIDGHSHALEENGRREAGKLVAQAGEYARQIGIIEITLENGNVTATARVIDVSDTELAADEAVIAKIAAGEEKVAGITSVIVGHTPVELVGDRESVRTGDTNLANLITDSMLHATGADIAFIGGGSIRAGIEAGDITMGDVLTVLPYANLLVTVELSGADVLEILEHGVSLYPEPEGQFIQPGGLHLVFDPAAGPSGRVVSAHLADGDVLQPDKIYTVATIEFIAAGGDGYKTMEKGTNLKFYGGDAEAFVSYLETNPAITETPEGRVKPLAEEPGELAAKAFDYFLAIGQIPRGSGNMQGISQFMKAFGEEQGLTTVQDEALNILIKKPGSAGRENEEPVILQAHMDMVCEKNEGVAHDFLKDPIIPVIDGDWVMANGTTLGADNGSGMALIMALLDADDLSHPPIEALFTIDEETTMDGAFLFDAGLLGGRRMINLDNEDEERLVVSCASAVGVELTMPVKSIAAPAGSSAYKLTIKGLTGGHSGMDIHKGLANANILMARLLNELAGTAVAGLSGGTVHNAIPRECSAVILSDDFAQIQAEITAMEAVFKAEFPLDHGLAISLEEAAAPVLKVLDHGSLAKVLAAMLEMPNGALVLSPDIEGLTQTSNNLGVIVTGADAVVLACLLRSSDLTAQAEILAAIQALADSAGAKAQFTYIAPAWPYKQDSLLRDTMSRLFMAMYGREAVVEAVHAGLECAAFAEKMPDCDIISCGPDIRGAHSPDERMSISSFYRTADFIASVLAEL